MDIPTGTLIVCSAPSLLTNVTEILFRTEKNVLSEDKFLCPCQIIAQIGILTFSENNQTIVSGKLFHLGEQSTKGDRMYRKNTSGNALEYIGYSKDG